MNKLLTEAIGTFFLVLTVGLTVLAQTPFAPLAIGCSLMIMVYMGGHISGAHYNPAVTLAVLMRGTINSKDAVSYWIAQIAGALLAALAVRWIAGSTFAPAPAEGASIVAVLLVEILYTFALALVMLNTATAPATAGNSYFGLAIGFTVVVGAFAGGPISGGAFNPAVGVGPILVSGAMSGGTMANLWYYLVGPLAGGALAAIVFRTQGVAAPKA
ncbi:MAG: MIP/aquaporin family protein [Longimicrobiales bacterium]